MVNLFSWPLTHHFCRLLQYDRVVHMDADTFVANVSIYSMSLWHWYSFLCCASRGVTDSTITTHTAMSMRQHGLQCAVRLIWYNAIRYNAMQWSEIYRPLVLLTSPFTSICTASNLSSIVLITPTPTPALSVSPLQSSLTGTTPWSTQPIPTWLPSRKKSPCLLRYVHHALDFILMHWAVMWGDFLEPLPLTPNPNPECKRSRFKLCVVITLIQSEGIVTWLGHLQNYSTNSDKITHGYKLTVTEW